MVTHYPRASLAAAASCFCPSTDSSLCSLHGDARASLVLLRAWRPFSKALTGHSNCCPLLLSHILVRPPYQLLGKIWVLVNTHQHLLSPSVCGDRAAMLHPGSHAPTGRGQAERQQPETGIIMDYHPLSHCPVSENMPILRTLGNTARAYPL